MCGSVSRSCSFDDSNRHIILSLVLTPHLARAKVRKEKKLLSGSDQPVEEPEEVGNDFHAICAVSIVSLQEDYIVSHWHRVGWFSDRQF
jgi:hypothetical protein